MLYQGILLNTHGPIGPELRGGNNDNYAFHVAAALFFLTLAGATTLTLPLAVRRMIDHGFSSSDGTFIANYFSMLVVIAAVLALASACRYYFVVTLGERVVADIRSAVFAHVTTLSPSFFDRSQSGEIISRLAADTTQIKSAVGATASVALRNLILGLGAVAMMVVTSPKLSGLVLAAIPVIVLPLVAFGRSVRAKSRLAQDTLADATAYASEQIGAVRTLHLRHEGEKPEQAVDVWLGRDQFPLPVKLRYPVARNRLVVEQVATSVRAR